MLCITIKMNTYHYGQTYDSKTSLPLFRVNGNLDAFEKFQKKYKEMFDKVEDLERQVKIKKSNNGFQIFDECYKLVSQSYGYNTYQEIHDAVNKEITKKKGYSVVIEINNVILTFNIADMELKLDLIEDA